MRCMAHVVDPVIVPAVHELLFIFMKEMIANALTKTFQNMQKGITHQIDIMIFDSFLTFLKFDLYSTSSPQLDHSSEHWYSIMHLNFSKQIQNMKQKIFKFAFNLNDLYFFNCLDSQNVYLFSKFWEGKKCTKSQCLMGARRRWATLDTKNINQNFKMNKNI